MSASHDGAPASASTDVGPPLYLDASQVAKGTRGQPLRPGPGRGKKEKTGGVAGEPPVSGAPTYGADAFSPRPGGPRT